MDANTWGAIGSLGQAAAGFLSLVVVIVFTIMQFRQTRRFAEQSRREADERSEREIEASRKLAFLERQDAARDETVRGIVRHVHAMCVAASTLIAAKQRLTQDATNLHPNEFQRISALRDDAYHTVISNGTELTIHRYLAHRAWGDGAREIIDEMRKIDVAAGAIIADGSDEAPLRGANIRIRQLLDALVGHPPWRDPQPAATPTSVRSEDTSDPRSIHVKPG